MQLGIYRNFSTQYRQSLAKTQILEDYPQHPKRPRFPPSHSNCCILTMNNVSRFNIRRQSHHNQLNFKTMKLVNTIIRIGLGLLLLAFGLNKFFWFMPDFDFTGYPEAEHLFNALRFSGEDPDAGKGYIMNMVGGAEALIGLMLIFKKWVPLALVMLVPISINLVMFHVMVHLPGIGPALLVAIINGYLVYRNWDAYKGMFS